MKKTIMHEVAGNENLKQPNLKQFQNWNLKEQSSFIKNDVGKKRLKYVKPGLWNYIFLPETDTGLRFKVSGKGNIKDIEADTLTKMCVLADRTQDLINNLNQKN